MTVDLVATDLARTITHDHYNQWHVLSTILQRFQHFSVVACRSFGVTVAIVDMKKVYNLEQKMNHNWQ